MGSGVKTGKKKKAPRSGEYSHERRTPTAASCGVSLTFTGTHLLMTGGKRNYAYPAVSGIAGTDVIPSGKYWINPKELWSFYNYRTFLLTTYVGQWHPGVPTADEYHDSWGDYRITIHPYPQTDTGGRGGFFIHGGSTFGSLGCIDLAHGMNGFVADLQSEVGQGTDCYIPLTVQ